MLSFIQINVCLYGNTVRQIVIIQVQSVGSVGNTAPAVKHSYVSADRCVVLDRTDLRYLRLIN